MRKVILVVATALLISGAMAQPGRLNVGGVGLQTPESVLYDSSSDVYLVSNINGNPTATDDNGFISRISPSGKVLKLKWIDGKSGSVTLNAPKGMAIVGNTLYVSDITAVRMFDRRTGRQKGRIEIAGSAPCSFRVGLHRQCIALTRVEVSLSPLPTCLLRRISATTRSANAC